MSSSRALRDTSQSSLGPLATRNTRSENNRRKLSGESDH